MGLSRRIDIEPIAVKFKKRLYEHRKEKWHQLLEEAIPSTDLGRGRTTSSMIPNLGQHKLENELKTRYKRKHCIFTNCASDALDLTVQALDFSMWQVPAYTWYSPINAIAKSGAKVHFLEVHQHSRCVNYETFLENTPCIVPHVDGLVANPPPDSCPFVIEDAAQSPISPGNNFGDVIILSFGSSKKLGMLGQGGCALTDNDELAEKLKLLSVFGLDAKRDLQVFGSKSFLDPYNALCTLEMLKWYDRADISNRLSEVIGFYNECAGLDHPKHLERYTIQLENREAFRQAAEDLGIETRVWFKDHAGNMPAFKNHKKTNLEISDYLCKVCVDVPMNELLTDNEVARVGDALKKAKVIVF